MRIHKAIFPVAGLGTRMLPATKAVPKEMLSVWDAPILEKLVEECVSAGIEEIIIVLSREKSAIFQHFDSFPELEKRLEKEGKTEILKSIKKFSSVKFSFVFQGEAKGDGHALLSAEHLAKDEPFLVIFGDELHGENPSSVSQLLHAFEQKNATIIGVRQVPKSEISAYGVVAPEENVTKNLENLGENFAENQKNSTVFAVSHVVEKPKPEDAPSNFAIIGKYICMPSIWKHLHAVAAEKNTDIRLADALEKEIAENQVLACEIEGMRFDTGNRKGLLLANIFFALQSGGISKEEILDFVG